MIEGKSPAWQEASGGLKGFNPPGLRQLLGGHIGAKCKVPDTLLLQSPDAKSCSLYSSAQVALVSTGARKALFGLRVPSSGSSSVSVLGRQTV